MIYLEASARLNLGVVLPLSVCKEGHLVVFSGQSRDINERQTCDGHGSVRLVRFQKLH